MKKGDRVMVVANAAIRENNCGMATLEKYIRTDPKPYGGYYSETWEVCFDGELLMTCNILVDESLATENRGYPSDN